MHQRGGIGVIYPTTCCYLMLTPTSDPTNLPLAGVPPAPATTVVRFGKVLELGEVIPGLAARAVNSDEKR